MAMFRGVGERMKERLRVLGYVKPNGELRVADFCMDFRYHPTVLYNYLADRRTPYKDLKRLAEHLQTSMGWLLLGEEIPDTRVPIEAQRHALMATFEEPHGGAAPSPAPPVDASGARRSGRAKSRPLSGASQRRGRSIMLGSSSTRSARRAA